MAETAWPRRESEAIRVTGRGGPRSADTRLKVLYGTEVCFAVDGDIIKIVPAISKKEDYKAKTQMYFSWRK
jgi:hypothetical protein